MSERKYPSDAVLIEAGRATFDWTYDTSECHFCACLNDDDENGHDDSCPLSEARIAKVNARTTPGKPPGGTYEEGWASAREAAIAVVLREHSCGGKCVHERCQTARTAADDITSELATPPAGQGGKEGSGV